MRRIRYFYESFWNYDLSVATRADQRGAIVGALRKTKAGLDATALGKRLGLHANTVRWHLAALSDQGVVTSTPEKRNARGRPTIVYRLTPDGAASDRDEYRLLATMLTEAFAAGKTPHDAGVEWGRELVTERDPGRAVDAVVDLLDEQGFAAAREGETIAMRRCPFYDLAAAHPEIVCALHHGLIEGALAATGGDVGVERLEPFVEPTLCIATLRRNQE